MFSLSQVAGNRWLAASVLALLCAVLLLPGLGRTTVARQQELRVLLSARDMAEGGNWLIPHFMGEERLRKPPLMYWLVAAAFKITGSTESAAAGRAISAAAGTALVLSTFLCGRMLIGRRSAFLGAIVLATSFGFIRHARLAETDIPQTLFCSLAILSAFAALTRRKRNLFSWLLAGFFAGIGFMFKGPASIAMPAAAIVTFGIVRAIFFRRAAKPRRVWLGALVALLVAAAIASPWYVAVALKSANAHAQAGDEISRLLTESAHKGPIIYYFYTLPLRLGIWGLALPVAIFGVARKLRHHRGPRFILCWLASSFVILSALSSKQSHYALLLFPPSALLVGWLLARAWRARPASSGLPMIGKTRAVNFQSLETTTRSGDFYARFSLGYLRALCALLAATAAGVYLMRYMTLEDPWPLIRNGIGTALVAYFGMGLLGLADRRNPLTALSAMICALALMAGTYATKLDRIINGDSAIPDLVVPCRAIIKEAPHFIIAGPHPAMIAWYAHRDMKDFGDDAAAAWHAAQTGDVFLCTSRSRNPIDISKLPSVPECGLKRRDTGAILYRKTAETKS